MAIIKATGFGQVTTPDVDNNGFQDILETSKFNSERENAAKAHQVKLKEIASKESIENRKLDVALQNQTNDLQIAKENAKGRNNKKS